MRGVLAPVALVLIVAAGGSARAQRLTDPVSPMLTGVDPERLLLDDRKDMPVRKAGPPDLLQTDLLRLERMAAVYRVEAKKRNAAAGAWLWFFIAMAGNAVMLAILIASHRRASP